MSVLFIKGYLYFPTLGPLLGRRSCPWLSALAPNLSLPALAPKLYLTALAPNLYLPALVPNSFHSYAEISNIFYKINYDGQSFQAFA